MILSFNENKAWAWATAPIMWWAGTTTVANIGTTTADLWGTYTSNGWSPITATWFVLYPAGNPSTIIWGSGVTDFPDATLPSPITASATSLTPWVNYCFKPYAINAIGTSYGTELCFTTLNIFTQKWFLAFDWGSDIYELNISTNVATLLTNTIWNQEIIYDAPTGRIYVGSTTWTWYYEIATNTTASVFNQWWFSWVWLLIVWNTLYSNSTAASVSTITYWDKTTWLWWGTITWIWDWLQLLWAVAGKIYFTSTGWVRVIDTTTNTVVQTIWASCWYGAIDMANNFLYSWISSGSWNINKFSINPSTGLLTAVSSIPWWGWAYANNMSLNTNWSILWYATQANLLKIDTASFTIIWTYPLPSTASTGWVSYNKTNDKVYISFRFGAIWWTTFNPATNTFANRTWVTSGSEWILFQ